MATEEDKLQPAAVHSVTFSCLTFNLTYKRDFPSYGLRLKTLPVREQDLTFSCLPILFLFLTETVRNEVD